MPCSDAHKRAFKKYYEKNRERLIEKAKIASKNRYVPVDKEAKKLLKEKKEKKTPITKTKQRISFLTEMIPLIHSRLDLEKNEEVYLPKFEEDGWTYYNFRKMVFAETDKEIYISRHNETHNESGWFYYKAPSIHRRSVVIGDWTMQDYKKEKTHL